MAKLDLKSGWCLYARKTGRYPLARPLLCRHLSNIWSPTDLIPTCRSSPLDTDQQLQKPDPLPWRLSYTWRATHGDMPQSSWHFPQHLLQVWHPSGTWQAQHHTHLPRPWAVLRFPTVPTAKLQLLLHQLQNWRHAQKTTKRNLLSLIGSLSFAAKAVPAGRLFLRRLINLSTKVHKLYNHITLNAEALVMVEDFSTCLERASRYLCHNGDWPTAVYGCLRKARMWGILPGWTVSP